ncbi:MAG: amino acid ABC transporter permease [Candidatus Puniceispirillaceae bacterium]|jgi:general L-amino acid transport system permease protein
MSNTSLTSLIYDARIRGYVFQVLILGLIGLGVWSLVDNTVTNLAERGKSVGFGFLTATSGFQISDTLGTWVMDYSVGESTYLDVYFIGIINTFLVAILGIIGATFLGFSIGIMRLSRNFIIRSFATVYIEILRNLPLLLQLFFWYFAVLRALPSKREKIDLIPDFMAMNITGLYLPAPVAQPGFIYSVIALGVAIIITFVMKRWAEKRQSETGQRFPVFWSACGILIMLPLAIFAFTGAPLELTFPEFRTDGPMLRRGFQSEGGMVLVPEMMAVWLALTLYTAAFIAEIVRAGILAINKGQTEASYSIGLKPGLTLRLVIIPQALRVIIPPLTSQYLNLTKNSSLAVAIAYPELVSVFAGTALNQVGKEIEMIFMMMMVYLTFSLATAAFMNWFNARVKLVER